MTTSQLIKYLRQYAAIASRTKKEWRAPVEALTRGWYATISEGETDPTILQSLREEGAKYVIRNYSTSDPQQQPTSETVIEWLMPSEDEPEPTV